MACRLYENDNKIEYRYGPSSVVNPLTFVDPETGPLVSLLNHDGSDGIGLNGDAASPVSNAPGESNIQLTGTHPDGTVYEFTKNITSTITSLELDRKTTVFPMPFSEKIHLINNA
jgi:hypothetical protein